MKSIKGLYVFLVISFLFIALFCLIWVSYGTERLLKSSDEEDMIRGVNSVIENKYSKPKLVPLLVDILRKTKSTQTKINAISALKLQECAFSAVPVLIECLKDKDQEVICNSADLLGILTYRSSKAVPALLEALAKNKGNLKVKLHIIKAIGEIGSGAISAVSILEENLKSTNHFMIIETRKSLFKIQGKQSCVPSDDPISVGGKKVKRLPMGLDEIYFEQYKDLRITALFEEKRFPDRSTFYIYLRNNIERLKNKKILIIIKGEISDLSVGAIIELLLKNDIPLYGKSRFYGKIKYSLPAHPVGKSDSQK